MAFRLYDPCLSCATHALPGAMPLEVNIRDHAGEIVRVLAAGRLKHGHGDRHWSGQPGAHR